MQRRHCRLWGSQGHLIFTKLVVFIAIKVRPRDVTLRDVTLCDVTLCDVTLCDVTLRDVTFCDVTLIGVSNLTHLL
jgi:hypothetical protein